MSLYVGAFPSAVLGTAGLERMPLDEPQRWGLQGHGGGGEGAGVPLGVEEVGAGSVSSLATSGLQSRMWQHDVLMSEGLAGREVVAEWAATLSRCLRCLCHCSAHKVCLREKKCNTTSDYVKSQLLRILFMAEKQIYRT